MGYFALLTPAFTGHLNPFCVLGRALMRRKHRVVMIAPLDAERKIRQSGLEFLPIGENEFPAGDWERRTAEMGELAGFQAALYVGKWLRESATGFVRDLPQLHEHERFDGLVMDQICIGAEAVCQVLRLPLAVACNALALNWEWGVPPPTLHWPCHTSMTARFRNLIGYTFWSLSGIPVARAMMPFRRKHRLGWMRLSHMNQLKPSLLQVAQQPAFFDFPRIRLPKCFHYTGPWQEEAQTSKDGFPWEQLDGRPLIYASLGTLQNRLDYMYRTIAEACASLDAQLVIALGRKDATPLQGIAGSPLVVGYAPQLALLKRAHLVITHGGLNTTLEALMHGLPMVALPITNDQPGVASRIVHLGVGERIPLKQLKADRLRDTVQQVLREQRYREKAASLARQMKSVDGPGMAAELIEKALAAAKDK